MVLGLNVIILAAAGVLFGWDKALYSIIFQYASTQVLHELYKKYQQNTVLVVTVISSAEIKKVMKAIKEADPHAFVNVMKTEQLSGRFYQKPTD